MRILIIDDSIEKISELSELIYEVVPKALVESCENITNAISLFEERDLYNLVVIDLLLPMRIDEPPREDGGEFLLNELYRKKEKLNIPNYIIGFTQYDKEFLSFSPIWKVIKYGADTEWRISIKYLLFHILNTSFNNQNNLEVLPSVFVEGKTDEKFLNIALNLYFEKFSSRIKIVSQKKAGAKWVVSQVVIWALGLQKKKESDDYIKAIGFLDSDDAGNVAKKIIDDKNLTPNQKKCFKIIQIKPKYNQSILEFYKKQCKIEIEIESLFPFEVLKYADEQEWLEYRTSTFIENPISWEQHKENSLEFITKQGISEESLIYLKKVKRLKKEDFCNYVISLENKDVIFQNFKPLLTDLLNEVGDFKLD